MKKKPAYHFSSLLISLIICDAINAQPFVTRIYTANNGLPDSYTQGIYQDKQGYLWISTYTGLSRFDGQHFATIEIKNNSISSSANVILQDDLGRLWVAYNKSVCLLDKDTAITFPSSDGQMMNYIFGAIQLKNKKIWALVTGGAYEFTGSSWEKVKFPDEYNDLNCRQVIETPEGLYINFGNRIALKKNDGSYTTLTSLPTDNFYVSIQQLDKRIYANTSSGLIKIENGNTTEIFKEQLASTTNYNFYIDSKKRFWISTEKYGILVSKPGEENRLDYSVSLPFNLSTYLFEDRDNNIWATNYEGLIKIKDVAFTNFDKTANKIYENIRHLSCDSLGNIFIASTGNGLYKIDNKTPHPALLNFSAIKNFIPDVVDGISFDNKNNLWVITRSKKLIKYDGTRGVDLSVFFKNTPQGLFSISSYDNDKMIIASDKLYIGNEKGFMSWGTIYHTKELLQPRFICTTQNNFFISTRDSGVYQVDKNGNAVNISAQIDVSNNFREVRIYEDPAGGIWVMRQGSGITKFIQTSSGHFKKIIAVTTKDGLPNNTIFSAVFDKQNNLWLTTLSGLAVVVNNGTNNKPNYLVNKVGEELESSVLNWGAAKIICDKQNNIWVSTFHEFIKIEPGKIQFPKNRPGISIENIKLNSKDQQWKKYTDSLTGYFHIPYKPVFNYKENSFDISFQGISFSVTPGLQYTYTLVSSKSYEDNTGTWSEPSVNNSVSFVKLPPGDYTFAVKARETGTKWSEPALFSFTIDPPFWANWLFRAFLILVTAALIWWMVRLRIKRIQKKSELQNQLHELEMKALKAQMNPHFIYNALNSIQSLVVDGKQQDAIKYISKFAKLLRQVLEHSGKNLVTLDKELNTIELYVQLEMLRMNMQLNYSVAIDENILPEQEWVPPLILQPFVENALWHGLNRKEGEKNLTVHISSDDDWIYATITDNGIGRTKAAELKAGNSDYPRSMGMEITGKRLQLVNRNADTGFFIKDLKDEQGRPSGTEVSVQIKRQLNSNPNKS